MLRFPRASYLAALLAVLLSLPSLFADFYCDDQVFVLRLDGVAPAPIPGPFALYTFASGSPDQRQRFIDHGPLPWWTIDGLRISFCRPLSSVLLALDHAVAGRHPLPYHLHSIAWYALAVLAAASFLRRVLSEREAALAALLFAVAPAHWMVAAWPSARHVAVSGAFAVGSIVLHLRARSGHGVWPWIPALACAVMALAGGETALGIFAYVLAYELLGRTERLSSRVRALAPWSALLIAYAILYRVLGYGAWGSAAYVDPIAKPVTYLTALPARLAVFAAAALLGPPSEISILAAHAVPTLATLGVLATIAVALLLRRAMPHLDRARRLNLRWLLAGAVLSMLPGAAGIPGDRVLFMPNIGIVAALAIVLLHSAKRGPSSPLAALPARAGVALFAVIHILFAPLLFAFGAFRLASTSHAAMSAASAAEIPARPDVRVYGVGLSDPLVGMYLASSLWLASRPDPRPLEVHLLSISSHDHWIKRIDDRTLEVSIEGGALLDGVFESLLRPPSAPLRAGDIVPFGTSTVRILADAAGHPTRFSVVFDRPVDDPAIALVIWRNGALRTIRSPPLGTDLFIPHEPGPMGL